MLHILGDFCVLTRIKTDDPGVDSDDVDYDFNVDIIVCSVDDDDDEHSGAEYDDNDDFCVDDDSSVDDR